jgi:hypothetical protein
MLAFWWQHDAGARASPVFILSACHTKTAKWSTTAQYTEINIFSVVYAGVQAQLPAGLQDVLSNIGSQAAEQVRRSNISSAAGLNQLESECRRCSRRLDLASATFAPSFGCRKRITLFRLQNRALRKAIGHN